ncbi:MAG: phosphoglycerate mutase [Curvibacter sp.]|nr:MAG: phosphoglycerate mutase [Curvibacter sp.]
MSEPNIVSRSWRLIVPYARCTAEASHQALAQLALPNLLQLSRLLRAGARHTRDEDHPSMPHEWALGKALGWPDDDSLDRQPTLPWAARDALRTFGTESRDQAWAWISPCHWQVGSSHISMGDPTALGLDETESRSLLEILSPFFKDDGIELIPLRPDRWLARGEVFRELHAASLDRVIGRPIDTWMPKGPSANQLRRLQTETQMLLYTHPFSEARQLRGAPAINSFWISGCGALPAQWQEPADTPQVLDDLRGPALAGDWNAWSVAWKQLDAGPIARCLSAAHQGAEVELTLCSEQSSHSWQGPRGGMLSRWVRHLQGSRSFKQALESL